MPTTKKSLIKKIEIAFAILVGLIVLLFVTMFAWQKYDTWKFNHDLAVLQAEEERPYREDIYGGATPKETLELFIAAVEKGDYDLASKYFTLSTRDEWNKKLKSGGEQNKLKELIKVTKGAIEDLKNEEPLWLKMNKYTHVTKPGNVIFDFIKYPNNNWKISEI